MFILPHKLSTYRDLRINHFVLRCDDGKAEDSGLKDPGFNPQPRQEKNEKYCLLFSICCFATYWVSL